MPRKLMLSDFLKLFQGSAAAWRGIGWSASALVLMTSGSLLVQNRSVDAAPQPAAGLLAQLQLRDVVPSDSSTSPYPSSPYPSSPSSAPSTSPSSQGTQTISNARFSCQFTNGDYVVMYSPVSRPGQSYPWATPSALGGGWSPERRCNEISRRLESYRPDGLLEMRNDVENGYNTICVTTQAVSSCRIVLTVPPGQDPIATRDRVFSNLTVADSGQQTSAVNTFTGNDTGQLINQLGRAIGVDLSSVSGRSHQTNYAGGINLRPFLDRADGGTGTRLR